MTQDMVGYEIRVRGMLGELLLSAFPCMQSRTQDQDTVLSGMFADQAALYGALAQLESLGLELVEVRRLPRDSDPESACLYKDTDIRLLTW